MSTWERSRGHRLCKMVTCNSYFYLALLKKAILELNFTHYDFGGCIREEVDIFRAWLMQFPLNCELSWKKFVLKTIVGGSK